MKTVNTRQCERPEQTKPKRFQDKVTGDKEGHS